MIGVVRSSEPILQIAILGSRGQRWFVDAVLDTGATCELTLPSDAIRELGLRWKDRSIATLAGDSKIESQVYEAEILWDGDVRLIDVHEMDGNPLIGTKLLEGYRIEIDLIEGGAVEVTPLNQNHNLEEQHDA